MTRVSAGGRPARIRRHRLWSVTVHTIDIVVTVAIPVAMPAIAIAIACTISAAIRKTKESGQHKTGPAMSRQRMWPKPEKALRQEDKPLLEPRGL